MTGEIMVFQMSIVFAMIVVALALYATEKVPLELTSFGVVCLLLALFYFFPVPGPTGENLLSPTVLLAGFASPAMLTVLALLVLGDGLARTGVLDRVAVLVHRAAKGQAKAAVAIALIVVALTSAVLNNIPVVVIFVPIMQSLATRTGRSAGRYMMPLSFAAILGGMTTLIGSSTNLLVSNELTALGEPGFGFFSFTIPGLVVAGVGMVYVLLVAPRLLGSARPASEGQTARRKQFIAEITIQEDSALCGATAVSGFFPKLRDLTVLALERDRKRLLPPYDDITLSPNDTLIVAAEREALRDAVKDAPTSLYPRLLAPLDGARPDFSRWGGAEQTEAEVMITPNSRMVGRTLKQVGFRYVYECVAVGLERRQRMTRGRITETPLEAGDILLVQGRKSDVEALRGQKDVILMEWSTESVIEPHHAKRAALIFLSVVAFAASGILPTEIAALGGAACMVLVRALTVEQAVRALDSKIVFLIAAALALGAAMQETGGALFLARGMLGALGDVSPAAILSVFFLLVACLANVLSTKATAVLFTPIAVGVARELQVPVEAFAVAVVFAANCSFASPVGYQTNLLVMGPGGYRFFDFVRVGAPLLIVCWVAFSLFAPWWYGL
ncbi:MAG: SLC13 family permease [Alphaproteobacteria bacterium]|nr:SLC13 family permease [Alphaproteobacteria bacterium]